MSRMKEHFQDCIERAQRIGCGYCTTCGYGGEPSDECLHKRPFATPRNMRLAPTGTVALDPNTGEHYSATPGDYFWMGEDEVLTSSEGPEPCTLVRVVSSVTTAAAF